MSDESRAVVDIVCNRVLRKHFDSGMLPVDVQPDALREWCCGTGDAALAFATALVADDEWTMVCDRVAAWQDVARDVSKPVLQRVFARFSRFPSLERVSESLGEDRAVAYLAALETIENDPALSAEFPSERASYAWRKFDLDAAVSVAIDVLAAHVGDEAAMSEAYTQLVLELRARRREKATVAQHAGDRDKRKAIVRSLGIWFPLPKDADIWRSDPRTAPRMSEFEALVARVSDRMKLVRSFLQHVPRRKLSNRTVKDLDANIERLRAYLRGEATVSPAPS